MFGVSSVRSLFSLALSGFARSGLGVLVLVFFLFAFPLLRPRLVSRLSSLSSHFHRHLISISLSSPPSSHLSEPEMPRCCVACVWNIAIDVKPVPWFFLVAGGCRECHSSAANKDGYDILWYRSGTLDRRTCINFHVKFLWWAVANPRTTSLFFNKHVTKVSNSFFILAQLAQSETAVNFMSKSFFDIWNQASLRQLTLAMAMVTPTTYLASI